MIRKLIHNIGLIAVVLTALAFPTALRADEAEAVDAKGIIFEHLGDHYGWEVPFMHETYVPLPVIVRDAEGSWHCFSSRRLEHGASYDGFHIAHGGDNNGKVVGTDATGAEYRPLDLTITKNVAALIIAALLVAWAATSVLRWYRRNPMKAPRGVRGSMEVIVEMIYFDVIRSNLGSQAKRFAPYLLTVFFLIFFMNLLGLIVIFPGGANLTGNLAVTLTLALCTFVLTNVTKSKHYWKEIFWPDVPIWLKCPIPIMQAIEVFGVFTKPAALTVRLFANMMGGHMIVIVLTLLIFIFGAFGAAVTGLTTVFSVAFSLFMVTLDLLVSFIQAFVFTMLSTLFISMAHPDESHEHHAAAEAA